MSTPLFCQPNSSRQALLTGLLCCDLLVNVNTSSFSAVMHVFIMNSWVCSCLLCLQTGNIPIWNKKSFNYPTAAITSIFVVYMIHECVLSWNISHFTHFMCPGKSEATETVETVLPLWFSTHYTHIPLIIKTHLYLLSVQSGRYRVHTFRWLNS